MTQKELVRRFAIEFAYWLDKSCIKDLDGWFIIGDTLEDTNTTCFKVDELYDYWIENVFLPIIEGK